MRNTCKSGMFLGYDSSVSTTGVSTYDPDIVSFDYCNWNGSGASAISYNYNSTVKNLNKTISVSCHMPNPNGGNAKVAMSASDFSTLASTQIKSITSSSSTMLQTYKAEVDKIAAGLSNLGTTVYFRPFHEMNGSWFWWGKQVTSDFINLWKKLYDYIINYKGLSNVKFVYAPNKGSYAADYYPGNSYVTWIGIDAYSDDPVHDSDIKTAYNALVGKGKTIGFSEIGPTVGGAYVDSSNNQIKKFDYTLWNNAINYTYTSASFFITWDGAYGPYNNTNGSVLFGEQSSW
ncbi:MAG: Mannan endo,4-beta-mannosidase [Firmicutes bacterium]|nr:Mannan endo,4-beta-mannosidase [Bacillota bacterium]